MSQTKRVSSPGRKARAAPMLGAAGLLALASSASAEVPVTKPMQSAGASQQHLLLGEEEVSDVSLSTFYIFDKENAEAQKPELLFVRGGGCGGCGHGCGGGGGCRGCGGCARGCGGGGCRGVFIGGCGGCGGCGCGGCGVAWWGVYGLGCAVGGGCCISWGGCRYC